MKTINFIKTINFVRTFIFLSIVLLLAHPWSTMAQEKLDRLGTSAKQENAPVMTVRTNGNILIASETQVGASGDINLLVIEYNLSTSTVVRRLEYGETNVVERPVDIMEEANGNILVLGTRRGSPIFTGASVQRTHGFVMRLQNSGTSTFTSLTRRDIIPPAPVNNGATIHDYQVFPARMRLDANKDVIVTGHTLEIDVTVATGAFSIGVQFRTWLMELANGALTISVQDDNYAGISPTQVGNLIILPNTDLLITGYTNSSSTLSPMVTITNSAMSTQVSTRILMNLPGTTTVSKYGNLYQSAMWNNELILVGDYVPLNTTTDVHDVIVAKAAIQNDRSVVVSSITAYNHPASVGGTIGDGNNYNDFHDFRTSHIVIKGNELMILGLVRDKNETQSPTFTEFCVMSVNLQDMSVNYTYVFSDMTSYGSNTARKIIVDNNGKFVFSGGKDYTTDKDLIIGLYDANTKLECVTNLEIVPYNLTWAHENMGFITGPAYTDDIFEITETTPTVTNSTVCTKGADPCPAVSDYVFYPGNSVIFANTVWGSQKKGVKYYINGTLTVQNVTLDITNCDVVFGPCAKIVFTGSNARLRANNSVFRPCDDAVKWKGLVFQGGSKHRVVDCEFKNAMTALEITNGTTNIEQIIDNTFLNNYIGVNLSGAVLNGTIAGNHFEVNTPDADANYLNSSCKPIPGAVVLQFYGIRAVNSVLWSPVANNEFVVDDPQSSQSPQTWQYYGVYFSASAGVIQANTFTNNTYAIYQTGNSASQPNFLNKIDNNSISLNRTTNNSTGQIIVIANQTGSINSIITNNKLVNTHRMTNAAVTYSGIYVESCNNSIVSRNEVRGFHVAVYANMCFSPEISLNDIKGAYQTGIYCSQVEVPRINCNVIDLQYSSSSIVSVGISLDNCVRNGVALSMIQGNCVYNTDRAIQIFGTAGLSALPSIRNNFLYNYINYGIVVSNATGNIGAPGVPGMNTFAKNNAAAVDIANLTAPFTATSNFFQTAPTFVNTIIAGGTVHSVASCGQQTSGPNSTISGSIDESFKCDAYAATVLNISEGGGGPVEFIIPAEKDGSEFMENGFLGYMAANAYGMRKNVSYLDVLKNRYQNKAISSNTYYTCLSQYAQAGGDYASAIKYLDMVSVTGTMAEERKHIELLRLQLLGQMIDLASMQAVRNELAMIIDKENENYNQAFYVLSLIDGRDGFRLPELPVYEKNIALSKVLAMSEQAQLMVSPNPVKTDLMVEIISSSTDLKANGVQVNIIDITGKMISTVEHDIVTGIVTMNMEGLPSGIYFLQVIFSDQTTRTVKFVKE